MAAPDHAQRLFKRFPLHPRGRPNMAMGDGGSAALAAPVPISDDAWPWNYAASS